MKLYAVGHGRARCAAAALRNCLSYENAPIDCPVRKCRRDGLCAGPLVLQDKTGRRLARRDAADVAPGTTFAPVCYDHVPDDVFERVCRAYGAHWRALDASFNASVIETTRVIAARRWRRLDGMGG